MSLAIETVDFCLVEEKLEWAVLFGFAIVLVGLIWRDIYVYKKKLAFDEFCVGFRKGYFSLTTGFGFVSC